MKNAAFGGGLFDGVQGDRKSSDHALGGGEQAPSYAISPPPFDLPDHGDRLKCACGE